MPRATTATASASFVGPAALDRFDTRESAIRRVRRRRQRQQARRALGWRRFFIPPCLTPLPPLDPVDLPASSASSTPSAPWWMRLWPCCASSAPSPPPHRRRHHRGIDKAAIGQPTNFQHTGHLSVSDLHRPGFNAATLKKALKDIAAVLKFDDPSASTPAPAPAPSSTTTPAPVPATATASSSTQASSSSAPPSPKTLASSLPRRPTLPTAFADPALAPNPPPRSRSNSIRRAKPPSNPPGVRKPSADVQSRVLDFQLPSARNSRQSVASGASPAAIALAAATATSTSPPKRAATPSQRSLPE